MYILTEKYGKEQVFLFTFRDMSMMRMNPRYMKIILIGNASVLEYIRGLIMKQEYMRIEHKYRHL